MAISGIELLKYFINIKEVLAQANGNQQLTWLVDIHSSLVFSDVMFVLMDRISVGIHPVRDK